MIIRCCVQGDEQGISQYYLSNAEHFRPWEFSVDVDFHSVQAWRDRLEARLDEQAQGRGVFLLALEDQSNRVIACCNLSAIRYGAFRACYLGYSIDKAFEGKGFMTQMCGYAISYAFKDLALNRIMANYMPTNHRSAALLKRLGFEQEGLAKRYLKINGRWEDHVMTSLVNQKDDS